LPLTFATRFEKSESSSKVGSENQQAKQILSLVKIDKKS
jgi:hypothetical protein